MLHVRMYSYNICISNYVNVYNVRIKGLNLYQGVCMYALANGDGVSGNVGLFSLFKHSSPAFSINSFA